MSTIYQKVKKGDMSGERESTLDAQAKGDLFSHYAPVLFAYFRQHTLSREDAEDLLHETFLAAWKWGPFEQLNTAEQEKWIWRVARNKVADTHRQHKRKPSLTLDAFVDELFVDERETPEYLLMRHEEYTHLRAALEQLPPVQQEALRLRFGNELSCAEVAMVLGKHEDALRSMLSRAVSRLRTIYTSKKEM